MDWQDEGVIVSVRKHSENSAIIEVLTVEHGRHAGVVRGGASRRMSPVLQPGNQVTLEWRARLEEHLGSYRVELLRSRSGVMADRAALAALSSICALISFSFPERMDMPELYRSSVDLLDALGGENWPTDYALWELQLLEELGFGLDFSCCAATGGLQELIYVSPKSGCAVSRIGAGEWAKQLLPLPLFLRLGNGVASKADVQDALKTTGYFLERWMAASLGNRPLPAARARLVTVLGKR